MSIIRYQTPALSTALTPFARLSNAFQEDVDRLFDLPFFGRESRATASPTALDIYQDKDQFIVKAELPGLKKEDIAVSLHEGVLTLAGERRQEKEHDEKSSVRNERWFGRFERTVNLPAPVDAGRVAASYEDGILTVTLPKAEQAKPRQIEIQAH
jgi:HSP20 family protein